MANKKINVEKLIKDLNPPKWKIWVNAKARSEAARSLGRMRKAEALEPLAELINDPDVGDAAVEALENMEIPPKMAAPILKSVMTYRQDLKNRFIEEYFNEKRNTKTMGMCDMPPATMRKEPESFLGAALSMYASLNPEKADELQECAREGLAPYSRKKFRENIKILSSHDLFPTWPELDYIDGLYTMADSLIVKIAGREALAKTEGFSDAAKHEDEKPKAPAGESLPQSEIQAFVEKALDAKSAITVPMKQVPVIMETVFQEIKNRYPLLDSQEIFKLLSGAIFLNCHYCGPLPPQYTQGLLMNVREAFEKGLELTPEMFDAQGGGSFAKGHSPGCPGTGVETALDPGGIEVPAKAIEAQREAAEKKEAASVESPQEAASEESPSEAGPEPEKAPEAEPEKAVETESQPEAPSLYDVYFKGDLVEGADLESAKKGLAALYKVDVDKMAAFFSGKPRIIKKGVDSQTAKKMAAAFKKVGAKAIVKQSQGKA